MGRIRRHDVLVLGYHGVGGERSSLQISKSQLERQLGLVQGRGYGSSTFREALEAYGRTVAVTFDDASATVFTCARPILDRLGYVATVFVGVGTVGAPGLLDWGQLAELDAAGWEIASHTRTHRDLTRLSDEELDEELAGSRLRIQAELGSACRSLAYPFGRADARVRAAAARAGYEAACIVGFGARGADRLMRPRVGLSALDGSLAFRLKIARPVRRLRATSLGPPLEWLGRELRETQLARAGFVDT